MAKENIKIENIMRRPLVRLVVIILVIILAIGGLVSLLKGIKKGEETLVGYQRLINISDDGKYTYLDLNGKTKKYNGYYHVLNGLISPIDGKNPEDLNIATLVNDRIKDGVKEVIIALNPSIEGEVTSMYIQKVLEKFKVKISRLSYGIPVGSDIEYLDPLMISKALDDRKTIS